MKATFIIIQNQADHEAAKVLVGKLCDRTRLPIERAW
ncbi:hypothetical protein JOE50_008037 [Bradyrhizobium japonicum]|nr:hypothetical protein [Bradyrhizobium japonicum]